MNGTGVPTGDLRHALGGTAGRRSKRDLFAPPFQKCQNAPQGGGLAGAGTAGQDKHTALHRLGNGAALYGVVGDALYLLQLVQLVLHRLQLRRLQLQRNAHPTGDVAFRPIKRQQIDIFLFPDGICRQRVFLNERRHGVFHAFRRRL